MCPQFIVFNAEGGGIVDRFGIAMPLKVVARATGGLEGTFSCSHLLLSQADVVAAPTFVCWAVPNSVRGEVCSVCAPASLYSV